MRHSWNVNGNDEDGAIGLILLPLQLGGSRKNGKNNLWLKKELPRFFFKGSRSQAIAIPN